MSTSPYAKFLMDEDAEKNGVEFTTPWGTFILARPGGANVAFKTLAKELTAPYRITGIDIEELMDDDVSKTVFVELYARTVVKGWSDVYEPDREDADGNTVKGALIPYSVANCIRVFTELEGLFDVVVKTAGKLDLFRKRLDEVDAKN